ncbi:MAG TPA: ABC transporter substrate-binding protein [Stellaceae bacterium]|jgi:NitT/TauT family transport system substrate-binding protein|nr:ABC transporter substrate-binding protein [Stellaceae bacterium]
MSLRFGVLIGALLTATVTSATAEKLKIAVPQRGFWDSEFIEFAQKEGSFQKAGLDIEIFWTSGGSETLQTVMTGSADIAMSNGTLGVVAAYDKGAPIRIIGAEMTGAYELYWYVPAKSPIHSLKDADGKTIAYSRPGSSSNLILLNLLKQANSKAKPVSTGGLPATHTQVMSGQIDIGWAVPPFGVKELNDNEIRIVAKSADAVDMQDQTIRVDVANLESLKTKREAITKFMKIIWETIEWSYSNPKVFEYYAEIAKVSVPVAKRSVEEFFPKKALQISEVRGLQKTLDEALQYKRLSSPKTEKDMAGLIDIVYKPGK